MRLLRVYNPTTAKVWFININDVARRSRADWLHTDNFVGERVNISKVGGSQGKKRREGESLANEY